MAGDHLGDAPKHYSHAPRVGAGEFGAAAATCRVEVAPATPTADGDGPDLLGFGVAGMEELAAGAARGAAGDRSRLAPAGIQTLLDLEEPRPKRSPRGQHGATRADRTSEPRQSSLGRAKIHGELLKLGLTVSQATASKYVLRPRRPPSQTWRTSLKNRAADLIALDFFTVPTATFRVLFVLVMLMHSRRRLVH
jgi:hypothetical protein